MLKFILILGTIAVVSARDVAKIVPYHVAVRNDSNHLCSGAIISDKWILTSAQRIIRLDASSFKIDVGSIDITKPNATYLGDSMIINNYFHPGRILYDFALIKVKDKIKFNDKVSPIVLSDQEFGDLDHVEATGWKLSGDKHPTNILQVVYEIVMPKKDCGKKLNFHVPESIFCTTYDFCKVTTGDNYRDVGGPVVKGNKMVGVVVHLREPEYGYPSLSARVYDILQWVKRYVK